MPPKVAAGMFGGNISRPHQWGGGRSGTYTLSITHKEFGSQGGHVDNASITNSKCRPAVDSRRHASLFIWPLSLAGGRPRTCCCRARRKCGRWAWPSHSAHTARGGRVGGESSGRGAPQQGARAQKLPHAGLRLCMHSHASRQAAVHGRGTGTGECSRRSYPCSGVCLLGRRRCASLLCNRCPLHPRLPPCWAPAASACEEVCKGFDGGRLSLLASLL